MVDRAVETNVSLYVAQGSILLQRIYRRGSGMRSIGYRLLAVVVGSVPIIADSQCALARELPLRSIVGGQRLQPHENQLEDLGRPDVTDAQAAGIDKLYKELMRCRKSRPGDVQGPC
jgi:hypothetical protein